MEYSLRAKSNLHVIIECFRSFLDELRTQIIERLLPRETECAKIGKLERKLKLRLSYYLRANHKWVTSVPFDGVID